MTVPVNARSPKSGAIKIALLVIAVGIAIVTLLYTNNLVKELQVKEHKVARMYAKSLEYVANPTVQGVDYSFILEQVYPSMDFPIILTDASDSVAVSIKNVRIDSTLSTERFNREISSMIIEMDRANKPIVVVSQDSVILNYMHYGESPLIVQLRWLPYVELGLAALFVLVGYIGFSYIKRSEQSNIWVGMARETAHQLGTPLSSLAGWIDVLKMYSTEHPKMYETVTDMENDVRRLNKVADRFSKIGSKPDLKEENLALVLRSVIGYFERRIPHMGKRVSIRLEGSEEIHARINRELFEWVIENLVKNALDAMEDGKGTITLRVQRVSETTFIDVIDTGKGIDLNIRNDIFRPGFSTKRRGWGLGLSLSKRIIESYHNGKIAVKESKPGVGTTFRITLRG
ncbi:MAG TPA: HAMP domain-containing sensor histidine kinase [Bacteroidota bacterium]|nr:HAMP domain-containing sensor histidine kinase [Bacteroidota bacterium]